MKKQSAVQDIQEARKALEEIKKILEEEIRVCKRKSLLKRLFQNIRAKIRKIRGKKYPKIIYTELR